MTRSILGALAGKAAERIANFTVITYTASLLLSSAAPVLAQGFNDSLRPAPAIKDLPLEPDTQFDAVRWYDEWWDKSVSGMKNIPGEFKKDLERTYSALKSVFNNGVKVGDVLLIRGGPDTARILKYHATQMGIHYRDTVKMLPEHVVQAGGRFVKAGKHIGKVASKNARHTANVAADQGKKIVEDLKDAGEFMGDIGKWMGENYKEAAVDTVRDLRDDAVWTKDAVNWSVDWTREQMSDAYNDTARWMKDYAESNFELTKSLADWTARQVPEGFEDTVRWTGDAARSTGRWTKRMATWTGESTADAVRVAGRNVTDAAEDAAWVTRKTADAMERAGNATQEAFEKALKKTAKSTYGKIPEEIEEEVERTKRHAKWLWKQGYEEGLKGGMELAGDNYFAGDIEGVAVATLYSLTAIARGVGYVMVLEPLAFTGHVGWGVTKTVGLGIAGTASTAGLAAAGVATNTTVRVGGAVLTTGVAALGGAYTAATAVKEGARIAGTATLGGLGTAGAAVGGGLYTVGAAGAGTVRTVGGVAVGGLATGAVGTVGLVGGEALIAGAGTVRMAGTAVAGTAMTAGALAAGGLKMTGDVAWGAVKMLGITAAGAAGEILVPSIAAGFSAGRVARIAGTAIVDNAIITPAVATWDILTALTLGGWDLVRDPALGTYHLVAGATGFSYRLVGLTTALAVTAVAGTLYALAKVPLSLVYYGGMWTIAAGGKLLDGLIAPLKFGTQNRWKKERLPQLKTLLARQEASVREEIGNNVTYIRVVFSGEDRGKVNFFTTQNRGRKYKFKRVVRKNCLVVYKSSDTRIVLNSGLYDRHCVAELER